MTPIEFLMMHRKKVIESYVDSPGESWRKLDEQVQISRVMKPNSFNAIIKAFVYPCRYYEIRLTELSGVNANLNTELETVKCELNNSQGLNAELSKTIDRLNEKLNNADRLNAELNNSIDGLNSQLVKYRLNVFDDDGLNTDGQLNKSDRGLNTMDEPVNPKLNISGWTVARSGRYLRAFKKINGRVHGVHLGKTLDGAEEKIAAKIHEISAADKTIDQTINRQTINQTDAENRQ